MRCVILGLLLLSVGNVRAEDWPQWLGPKRDGEWRETGIIDTLPSEGTPKKLWEKPIGIGYGGPAVANGKLYVMDRALASGAKNPDSPFDLKSKVPGNERILCLDAKTGETLWKLEYPCSYQVSYSAGPRCTPTVDGDRVYALGAMGDLTCLDAKGEPVWKKNFVTDYGAKVPVWGFAAHPLVDGDNLICLAGGSDGRLVIAFDKKTGKEVWVSQSCEGDFGYCPPVIYTFGGVRQLVIWHARALLGLDPASGKRLWSVPFDSRSSLTVPMPRKVGDDGLFISSFYNGSMLVKVTADSARVVWKSKATGEMPNKTLDLSTIMCTPWVEGDYTYGVCSHGELRCIVTATGERKWMTMQATRGKLTPARVASNPEPNTQSERWGHAFIIKHENKWILFNEQGDLIFAKLSEKGYEELSRSHLIDPTNTMARGRKVVWMHPAFADKCVFVRNDEKLVCYSLAK